MVQLSWSGIVLIIYAVSYALIVLAIGIMVYHNRKNKNITYCEELVHQREIYGAIIVHIYDQSTDVAMIVNWGRLTVQELNGNNIEGINMLSFFLPGIFVMILYRFITVWFALYGTDESMEETKMYHDKEKNSNYKRNICSILFDILLATFDLYFVKVIYFEFLKGLAKPNKTHRSLQLCESLFESMPQVVLQSVFLLRYSSITESKNDPFSLTLTILSITASLLSIANKYSWFDEQACVQSAKEMFCFKMHRFPNENQSIPFSWKFIIRSVWRWSDLAVRFVIFSLLWVCIGGFWFIIYFIISFIYYFIIVSNRIIGSFWYRILATIICEVGIILDYEIHFCIIRCIDNGIMLILISSFLLSQYQCKLGINLFCSENSNRNISENRNLIVFLFMGWIGYFLELICYPILQSHKLGVIKKSLHGREFFNIILHGDDSNVPIYFLTFFIENTHGLKKKEILNFNTKKSMEDLNKLAEDLEAILYPGDIAGDIAINSKNCQPFKYGISIQIIHNFYDENGIILTGDIGMKHIKKLYENDSKYYMKIIKLFKKHFNVDMERDFQIKCTRATAGFLMLKDEKEDIVISKYRFGEEVKKYNKYCRIIRGHDYDDLYNKDKQVMICVIDHDKNGDKNTFNEDLFKREKFNLQTINNNNNNNNIGGILPFKGCDTADDAYFVVTKALNGLTFLEYITKKQLTMKNIIYSIIEMFKIVEYIHSNNIVHRNINLENFQFININNTGLTLNNYEYSKYININSDTLEYGNISGKVLYLSPELCFEIKKRVLIDKKWNENSISGEMYAKSDVWALGILCYFLIIGKRLFYKSHSNTLQTIYKIISFKGFNNNNIQLQPFKIQKSNELFIDFMNKILTNNYAERMNISECLNHSFLSAEHINNIDEDLMIKNDILLNQLTYKTKSKLHSAILKIQVNDMIEREITQEFDDTQEFELTGGTHKDFKQMEQQFKRMDLDNDGYTTLQELTTLLTSLGYCTNYAIKQSKIIMNELDENGDGKIEFKEFAKSWLKHKLNTNDKYIHAIFQVFDINNDGIISVDELRNVLFKNNNEEIKDNNDDDDDIPEPEDMDTLYFEEEKVTDDKYDILEEMLKEIDENRDGKISFDEFYKAMNTDLSHKNESNLFNAIIQDINFKIVNEFGKDPLFENSKDYKHDYINTENNNKKDVNIGMNIQSNLLNK